jgi:hypothetical protein
VAKDRTREAVIKEDSLHKLVQSLDKNEKGYFKKFTARYGSNKENDYMKLFDLLEKAEVYDDEKIKKQWAKAGKTTNLSGQKNYLYEQIIRALRSYNSGKTISYSLTERLLDIQNLIDKNLHDHAFEMIYETIEKAEKAEAHEILFQLKQLEDNLKLKNFGRYTHADVKQVKDDSKILLEKINDEFTLNYLLLKMKWVDDRRGDEEVVSNETKQAASDLIKDPVFERAETLSLKSKITAYAVLHLYHSIQNEDAQALHYMKLRHDLYNKMELDTKTTHSYLANLSNIIMMSLNVGDMKEALHYLNALKKTTFKDVLAEAYRKRIYPKNLVMYLMANSLYAIDINEILEAESAYEAIKPELLGNNNLMTSYYIAILFYNAGNTERAVKWFNLAIDHKNVTYTNVQAYCRILIALIHYEQDNLSLLDSSLQSAQYFIKKNNLQSGYLKNSIALLSKLPGCVSNADRKEMLQNAITTFNELNTTEFKGEITYFHDFGMATWCSSRLNLTTYSQELISANKALTSA